MRSGTRCGAAALVVGAGLAASAGAQTRAPDRYPEGAEVPRSLTPEEADLIAREPIRARRESAEPPTGPVRTPGEYEPMQAIMLAWEGSPSWLTILATMAANITTLGQAQAWVVVDTSSEQTSAASSIQAQGADMSRVRFFVRGTDTIWIRDYGPRYVYEGDCRAIVDHTYNRPRPNDDALPLWLGPQVGHEVYRIPLVHGGGNYHLAGDGDAFATRLINNENPGLGEAQIVGLWADYQNVETTLYAPFPTSVDSTQHIDMWCQIIGEGKAVVSTWPTAGASTQAQICDAAAADLQSRGYQVWRVPARSVSTVHYTYTNVVMCNDLVLIPSYTNSTIVSAGYNEQALATWQAALPGKTIVQVPAQAIVTSAGVLHCIAMHVPAPRGGLTPTAYLRTLRGGQTLTPGDTASIGWISDDDVLVTGVTLEYSIDDGATWTPIASGLGAVGSLDWAVPDVDTARARVRVTALDAQGRSGADASPAAFTIGDPRCPGDANGDTTLDAFDFNAFVDAFNAGDFVVADVNADTTLDAFDFNAFVDAFNAGCP